MGILNKHELEKRLSTLVCLFQMFWTMNKNPNQIMNDIIKLRHSSNGDTYKFHRIFPLDFYVAILTFIPIAIGTLAKKVLNAYANRDKFMLCLFRERLQLIGLKSFHQYDDGRKIFQRQFTAHFSIFKIGINQFVIYSAKLMYVIHSCRQKRPNDSPALRSLQGA